MLPLLQRPSRLLFLLLLFLLHGPLLAQTTHTLSGSVRDSESGELLLGASVFVPALTKGTTTGVDGTYSLELPAGRHQVHFSFIGYQTITKDINLTRNQSLNVSLGTGNQQLQEVVVEANSYKEQLETPQMSMETVTMREAKLLPALFGEVDIIKTLQLKPGVQSGSEGSTGLYVRGGGPDQNLMLLDGATVYNASHLFGFFSIFNPDAVQNVELYKGGFPARFGGRLSSVVDVSLREGDKEGYSASGGIGLISSRFTVEGPIQKGKSSFLISGRRTYFDIFTRQINRIYEGDEDYNPIPDYFFYDLNGKFTYQLSEKDKLSISGYYGNDVFGFSNDNFNFDFHWGNRLLNGSWQHFFSDKLVVNNSVTYTRYIYSIENKFDVFNFNLSSHIRDYTFRSDWNYQLNTKHTMQFGLQGIQHQFEVGRLQAGSEDGRVSFSSGDILQGSEYGLYISDDYEPSPSWAFNGGLRLSGFVNGGKNYMGLEPRFSVRHSLTEDLSVKGSYAKMYQYVHMVSNTGGSLPTDIWYPSSPNVKPQTSHQVALGATKLLKDGEYLLSNEVYYKWMKQQLDFRDGAQLFVNNNLEEEFLYGDGYSYGNEIYLERQKGRLTGWIGYTLSWTWRRFDEINDGEAFPTRYDRRHDLTTVLMYKLNKRINLTGSWVFGSGYAASLPSGRLILQGPEGSGASAIPIYKKRNDYRMPAYHRLDLGLVYKLQPKRGEADLTFSLVNAYNRRNPYLIYFENVKDADDNYTLEYRPKQISLFPMIPSVTYNFKF